MSDSHDFFGKNHEQLKKMPLYQKSRDIMEICNRLIEILPEGCDDLLTTYATYIKTDANLIPAKIAGAQSVDLYDIRMEYATIIRKTARDIIMHCVTLESFGFKEVEYVQLLKKELEEFRILFAEWVKTFDIWNYTIDRWGVFNPPGIQYDDKNPDDDLPLNPDDFFEE